MSRISRQSPAILVAVIALVAALAGTAVAGPGASTSAVDKSDVRRIAAKKADKAVNAAFPVTSAKLGTINTRTQTQSINSNQFGEATANCQAGEKALSGGARGGQFLFLNESHKQAEGWRARAFNFGGNAETLTVEVYCLVP
jgi:hypothetical protein